MVSSVGEGQRSVGATSVAISLITFTLVYAALAAVEFTLLIRYAKAGPAPDQPAAAADETDSTDERPMAFAY